MKNNILLSVFLCFLINNLSFCVEEKYHVGICGDNVGYRYYYDSHILHVMGSGSMWNYDGNTLPPWNKWKNGIEEVIVHEGVTSIGANTFSSCYNLKRICCEEGLLRIEHHAFDFCYGLRFVDIPSTLNYIGNLAFRETKVLDTIQYRGSIKQWCGINHKDSQIFMYARNVFFQGKRISNLVIPSDVEKVSNHAFSEANFADSIILYSTTVIEDSSFSIINKPTQLIGCLNGISEDGQQWVIENGRLTIVKDEEVRIDKSWKKYGAFLTSLSIIGSNVSLLFVDNNNSYMNLKECTLPNSVKSIHPLFFKACPHLRQITILCPIPPTVLWPEWMEFTLHEIKVIVPENSVDKYKEHAFWQKFNICSCDHN